VCVGPPFNDDSVPCLTRLHFDVCGCRARALEPTCLFKCTDYDGFFVKYYYHIIVLLLIYFYARHTHTDTVLYKQ